MPEPELVPRVQRPRFFYQFFGEKTKKCLTLDKMFYSAIIQYQIQDKVLLAALYLRVAKAEKTLLTLSPVAVNFGRNR